MDGVLRGDFEARAVAYRNADYMTIAEKRRAENLPYIDGTDRIIINSTMVPFDQVDEMAAARNGTPATIPAEQVRSLMGRLSRQKALSDVDPAALTEGLNGHAEMVRSELAAAVAEGADVATFRSRLKALEAPA
jgi:hypothetical protein